MTARGVHSTAPVSQEKHAWGKSEPTARSSFDLPAPVHFLAWREHIWHILLQPPAYLLGCTAVREDVRLWYRA